MCWSNCQGTTDLKSKVQVEIPELLVGRERPNALTFLRNINKVKCADRLTCYMTYTSYLIVQIFLFRRRCLMVFHAVLYNLWQVAGGMLDWCLRQASQTGDATCV